MELCSPGIRPARWTGKGWTETETLTDRMNADINPLMTMHHLLNVTIMR